MGVCIVLYEIETDRTIIVFWIYLYNWILLTVNKNHVLLTNSMMREKDVNFYKEFC